MSRTPRRFARLAFVASAVVAVAACSKSGADANKGPAVKSLGGRVESRPTSPAPTEATATADEPPASPTAVPAHVDIPNMGDAAPVTYQVQTRVDSGPKEDPDLAVVEGGRRAASACFTGISDGSESRTASITVTVLPSGSVSRTEVSAESTHEPWVLSCLENVGPGLRFSDKPKADIRTFSISVAVSRSH